MVRFLLFALIASLESVAIDETARFSFAEAFTSGDGQALEIGYRVYTAPMLTEISAAGVLVDRLEIWPTEMHVRAGAGFSLQHLQVTAFGPDGNIEERVPLTLDLEGPAELLDFDDFKTFGNDIRATRQGQARIWITSVLPSASGEHARGSVLLVIK